MTYQNNNAMFDPLPSNSAFEKKQQEKSLTKQTPDHGGVGHIQKIQGASQKDRKHIARKGSGEKRLLHALIIYDCILRST